MIIKSTVIFKKQYQKLPPKFQTQFDTRLRLFISSPADERLRNHPLKGAFAGYWSINISGDLRALYRKDGEEIIIFALIGTHSQLYG
jgi:addiction module RelE/StbE family toxin